MIPTPEECLRLMAEYRMPANIQAHSLVVARIAEFLGRSLHARGLAIDVDLVLAAALMHDIAKSLCFDNDRDHSRLGEEICIKHGFPELAPLVAQHVVLDRESFPHTPLSAKELVYYADKRVNHDRIVSLDSRLAYILDRYGQNDPARHAAIRKNFARCQAIEREIFHQLEFEPADLERQLERLTPVWVAVHGDNERPRCGAGEGQ